MAMTTTSMIRASTFVFEDIFHDLYNELEAEANEYHLNQFYLDLDDEIGSENRSSSQIVSTSENQDDPRFFHNIPNYLSTSSLSFQAAFFSELRSIYNPIDFKDLQQLTMLTHQMSILHLHQELWHRFLQSGTGQIKSSYPADISVALWPNTVTVVMKSQRMSYTNGQNEIDQDMYVGFVQNYLQQLEKKANRCRLQFDAIKIRLPGGYTTALYDKIEQFVQNEGLMAMRFHFQTRIALIDYSSIDRSYQWQFSLQKPTHLQFEAAKHICSLTLDKEKAEQELILFKFGIFYKRSPKSLDILEDSLPTSITTISDSTIRERLSNEYIRIIQRAKADLMSVLTTAAESKKIDCQKIFDKEIAEIWNNQRQLPVHERLTTRMLTTIEQRQKNIIECAKRIYELKGNLFLKAPRPRVTT